LQKLKYVRQNHEPHEKLCQSRLVNREMLIALVNSTRRRFIDTCVGRAWTCVSTYIPCY